MSDISNVVLVGATGKLGPAILKSLRDAGFKVTVFTRPGTSHSFPSDVSVAAVDYESVDTLAEALKGQDAVVSTLGPAGFGKQLALVEAATRAGVKRFIPSEFGSNTIAEKTAQLPFFADKVAVQKALRQHADAGDLTYTLVMNGPFLDWGIQVGFILSVKNKAVNLYDGGDRLFSTSRLSTVGKAVAGVLKNAEETKNRAVYIQDTAVTLKKLAAMGKAATGSEGWKEEHVATDNVLAQAREELKKEKPDPNVSAVNFIKVSIWGHGYGSHFEKLDNELLGIEEMTDGEVQDLIRAYT